MVSLSVSVATVSLHDVDSCSMLRINTWRTSWTPPWTSAPCPNIKFPKHSIKSQTHNLNIQTRTPPLVVSCGLRSMRICLHPLGCASSDRDGSPIRTNASSCGRSLSEPRTLPRYCRQSAHPSCRQGLLGLHGPRHRLSGDHWPVVSRRCVRLTVAPTHAFLTILVYSVVRSASSHKILTVFGEVRHHASYSRA